MLAHQAILVGALTRPLFQRLINRSVEWLDWYERRLCWLVPSESIRYVLRPIKGATANETLRGAA